MKTGCSAKQVEFEGVGPRKLVAAFDADHISSDGGLVLLHRTDLRFGLMRKLAACFRDYRAPELVHHSVEELVRQRVFGIACGYEDLVDHARDGAPTRAYRELRYRTVDSWTRERRVVAKAEWLGDKHNPRFVVTSLSEKAHPARALYVAGSIPAASHGGAGLYRASWPSLP